VLLFFLRFGADPFVSFPFLISSVSPLGWRKELLGGWQERKKTAGAAAALGGGAGDGAEGDDEGCCWQRWLALLLSAAAAALSGGDGAPAGVGLAGAGSEWEELLQVWVSPGVAGGC